MPLLRDNVTSEEIYKTFYKFGKRYGFELPTGPEERYEGKTDDLYKLNWMSIEDLDENEDLLDYFQQRSLKAALNPHVHQEKNMPIYLTNLIISITADASFYNAMCHCGTKGCGDRYTKKLWCNHWRFCDRCANLKRQKNYRAFSDYYHSATENLYFITLTLKDKINFNPTTFDLVDQAWDRLNDYAQALYKRKLYSGALVTEEFSVDSLDPDPIVNPHIHMLCSSAHELESHVFEDIKIDVKPVVNKRDWINKIDYLTKSTNLAKTYISQWTRDNAEVVNRNIKEVIQGYKTLFPERRQSKAVGIFHRNSKFSVALTDNEYIKLHKIEKKTCKISKKKIQYNETMYKDFEQGVRDTLKVDTLPESTATLLKHAYKALPTQEKPPQQSHWLRNALGLGALGASGAYLYGSYANGGNNVLSDFSNVVNNKIIDPTVRLFKPNYYSNQKSFMTDYKGSVNALRNAANIESTRNVIPTLEDPADRAGTPWEDQNDFDNIKGIADHATKQFSNNSSPTLDKYKDFTDEYTKNLEMPFGVTGAVNNAHALSSSIPGLSFLSKYLSPGVSNTLGLANKAIPVAGQAAAVLGGINPSVNLADQISGNNSNLMRDYTIGSHGAMTLGGGSAGGAVSRAALPMLGRILLGAGEGAATGAGEGRLAGLPGTIAGATAGALAVPYLNTVTEKANNENFFTNMNDSNSSTLLPLFNKALHYKLNGNELPLRAWYGMLNPDELNTVTQYAKNINSNLAKKITDNIYK